MRTVKLLGALVAVLAFAALALAATASAAEVLWRWLPGSVGETFKGEQPKEGRLETEKGQKYTCAKGKIASGELVGTAGEKDATLWLVVLDLEGCKFEGLFSLNTLGDASGIILVHLEIHNCVISKAEKRFGLLILPLPIHIEVPAAGLLITINEKVLYIAELKEEGKTKAKLIAKQEKGKQAISKCEGGAVESWKWKVDNEAEVNLGLSSETIIEYGKIKDVNGEEIME